MQYLPYVNNKVIVVIFDSNSYFLFLKYRFLFSLFQHKFQYL